MPTLNLQVDADTDDCFRRKGGTTPSFTCPTPTLYVGDVGGTNNLLGDGMRFLNVTIPKNSVISTAYIEVRSGAALAGTVVNSIIHGEAADDPITFSDEADFDARAYTTASVNWNAIPAWLADTWYGSDIEIKTIIQELVNRAGWVSGNDIVIIWEDFAGNSSASAYRDAYGHSTDDTKAAKLHIEYTLRPHSFGFIIG